MRGRGERDLRARAAVSEGGSMGGSTRGSQRPSFVAFLPNFPFPRRSSEARTVQKVISRTFTEDLDVITKRLEEHNRRHSFVLDPEKGRMKLWAVVMLVRSVVLLLLFQCVAWYFELGIECVLQSSLPALN